MAQSITVERGVENCEKDIFERVEEHSRKFDKETTDRRVYPSSEIKEAWQTREWKIGDTTIRALGVSHVPETFLEYRQEIEKAIQGSDVVVNEFAPEALGFYDKEAAPRLKKIKSSFNEGYDLEQLRQAYLKYERPWNLGVFHHEVELLAAKHGKDMALADLTFSKDPEASLQDSYLYAYGAEQTAEQTAMLKKVGLYAGAAALGVAGLKGFVSELQKPMSRRKFLKLGLMAGVAAIAGVTPKITETPPKTAVKKSTETQAISDDQQLEMLRDPKLADALQRLVAAGYKNIAFIYGTGHLKRVEEYLNNPERGAKELESGKAVIEHHNPDAFRIYRLADGENTSEKFVASDKKVWRRMLLEK